MKKLVISALVALTLGASSAVVAPVANAQSVWVELHGRGNGKKYHFSNPGKRFGKGLVNHRWSKVSLTWAKQHGYSQSLR